MIRRPKKKRVKNPFKPDYAGEKRRREEADRETRRDVRERRHRMDGGRCVFPTCRRFVTLAAAHIHEEPPRSQGGDPLDIEDCLTVCAGCHRDMHVKVGGRLKRIDRQQPDRSLRFFERPNGNAAWSEVS